MVPIPVIPLTKRPKWDVDYNVFTNRTIKVNEKCVFEYTKESINSLNVETSISCKILKFSSSFDKDEILTKLSEIKREDYPNLFIFIIELEKSSRNNHHSSFIDIMREYGKILIEFDKDSLLIFQLSLITEKLSKLFYKDENSSEFIDMDDETFDENDIISFPKFLQFFMSEDLSEISSAIIDTILELQDSSKIIKYLKVLDLGESVFENLVTKCAAKGSATDLQAVIDGFIDKNGYRKYLGTNYITNILQNSSSVLCTAVQSFNIEVINYLIKNCSDMIQKLPFQHQVEISNTLFLSKQYKVLCEFLEYLDFPFPNEINNCYGDEKLLEIITKRNEFHKDIASEKLTKLRTFASASPNIKLAYSPQNVSALSHALDIKKFNSFFLLKSLGYMNTELENFDNNINNDKNYTNLRKFLIVQEKENVSIPALSLCSKSFIYLRRNRNDSIEKDREKIKNWFNDIYNTKYGSKLIDAAAQCESLKIIFDFECNSDENIDVSQSSECLGITYLMSRFIFVGSKLTGEKMREQQIKGNLVHEICHYVMKLVYENNFNPYFKEDYKAEKQFDEIVSEIQNTLFPITSEEVELKSTNNKIAEEWKNDHENSENLQIEDFIDDECDGIISNVYKFYSRENLNIELIVKPLQIQVQFDDSVEKTEKLQKIYKQLFAYMEKFVLPEIKNFNLMQRIKIKKFNDCVGVLPEVKNFKIELLSQKTFKKSNYCIIITNAPKLLLLDSYKNLCKEIEYSMNHKNIFLKSKTFQKSWLVKSFKEILQQNSNLNVFIDCSNGLINVDEWLNLANKSNHFNIIVSNQKDCEGQFHEHQDITTETINYGWKDLNEKSQFNFIQQDINFQGVPLISLFDLLGNEMDQQTQVSTYSNNFDEIIDEELLKMLLEKSSILVNTHLQDDFIEKNFEILYQSRKFLKVSKKKNEFTHDYNNLSSLKANDTYISDIMMDTEGFNSQINQVIHVNIDNQILQDQMLDDIKNKKYVLISDRAGAGKSWFLKNLTIKLKEKYPKNWITFVDLKQYIRKLKTQDIEIEFTSFMTKKILNQKKKFELEIFKKLYKNGKVCIIFDGYNEIDPYCTKIVTKLFEIFQRNGGNQLWIATRDYLEEDLKEKLELDAVYKLKEFTKENGIKLIVSNWTMGELQQRSETMTESEKINTLKTLQNIQVTKKYKKSAKIIIEKMSKKQNNSIGLPQLYKKIADISKNNKHLAINYTTFKIFEECVNLQYEIWSQQNEQIRSNANAKSQHMEVNFHKLHQLVAMESLFPEESNFCSSNVEDIKDWTDDEIIKHAILINKNRKNLFSHETYREFFAAKYILSTLEKEKDVIENVWKFLTKILSLPKFEVIRMFLNEALGNKLIFKKIEQNLPKKVHKCFDNTKDYKILTQMLEINYKYLARFLIKVLKRTSQKKIKQILLGNKKNFVLAARNKNVFDVFQNILMENFCAEEIKEVLIDNGTILSIIVEINNEHTFENFLCKISNKISLEFVKDALQMKDGKGENLLFYLIRSKNFDQNKCKGTIKILQKYLSNGELVKLAIACNNSGENLLQICLETRNVAKFKFFWKEWIKVYTSEIFSKGLKNTFYRKLSNEKNILHIASTFNKITFHKIFWKFLIKTFENREELKDLIMQKDRHGNNFIHNIVMLNQTSTIEFYVNKIKENFAEVQFQEIFSTKGCVGRNVLHIAACTSKEVKTHQILWQTFRNFLKSDNEFFKFIKETDNEDCNVVTLTAYSAESEELEFMINELKKIVPTNEIKQILGILNVKQQNMFYVAAKSNRSLKFHQSLWKILESYFDSEEIFNMIKHVDEHAGNLLAYVIENNTKEILEFIWRKIKNYLKKKYVESFENKEFISNSFYSLLKGGNEEKLKFLWNEIKNIYLNSKSINYQLKELLNYTANGPEKFTLHPAAFCKEVNFHRVLWAILEEYFNHQEIKQFLNQKNIYGYNFTQLLVNSNNVDVIEFTFQNLQNYLLPKDFEEISKSKDFRSRNLLQNASRSSTGFQTYKFLWEIYKKMWRSEQEFINLIGEIDVDSNNIFYNVASFASSNIFKFILSELEKIVTRDKIRKFLSNLGDNYQNLLQVAAKHNKSLIMHKTLWKVMTKYFEPSEILQFFYNTDEKNYNLILIAVRWNTKEIIKFTWKNIATFMNQDKQVEYLKSTGTNGEDILKISLDNRNNNDVYDWVMKLLDKYEKLLNAKNMDSNPFEGFEFKELENKSDEELLKELLNAIHECNVQKVMKSIRNGVDVNQADERNFLAIEYAWLNYTEAVKHTNQSESDKFDEIILALLNANSKFPNTHVDFCYENAPKNICSFIDMCESVHRHIFENNFEEFQKVIYNNSHLRYFHDRFNETAYLFALKRNNFFPLDNLNSILSIREDESTKEIYYEFTFDISDDLSNSCNKLPPLHIVMLNAKSRIYNTSKYHESLIHIYDAFKVLDSINSCSVILKLLSVWKKLKIKFDFKHDSAYYLQTNLENLSNGIIVIGAKEFVDYKNRYKVISILINQLFHCALYITYMNSFNPYPFGESVQKDQYDAICNDIIEKNEEIKPNMSLITSVQNHYEFIVRAIGMIILNFENYSMIVELQQTYGHLYDYLNNFVVPQMEATIKIIKKIQDENEYFTFNDLTDSFKRKILHSKIKFQDQETTFYEMFENDEEILKLLTPNDIRRLLLRNENLKVGCSLDINLMKGVVDRKFICFQNIGNDIDATKSDDEETFDDIVKNVETLKIFTLCDTAGSGKTVTFESLALELKQKYKSYWVSLVKLRHFYDDISKIKNNFNDKIFQDLLRKVAKIDSDFDGKIFEKLYTKGKVIILFDGVDEILPRCNEIFTKMIMEISENSHNQLWISTRPLFADKLKQFSKGNMYKLSTITKEEKNILIKEICKNSENILHLTEFLDVINYNSPLVINIMADLVATKEINFQTKSYNFYHLFDKLIEKLTEKFYIKIPFEDNLIKTRFTIDEMHKVFALKSIFNREHDHHTKDLINQMAFVKNWHRDEKKWTFDKIQRYGFLSVNVHEVNKECIGFIHKTYKEYFLAQFFISYLFDDTHHYLKVEVFEKVFELLRILTNAFDKFKIVLRIIVDYAESEGKIRRKQLDEKIRETIIKNIKFIAHDVQKSPQAYNFWNDILFDDLRNVLDELIKRK